MQNVVNNILSSIQKKIQTVEPTATIFLFGSRVNGTASNESDWDILILLKEPVNKQKKRIIQDIVFPFSVTIGAFINLLIIWEIDWLNNPSYYSLHQTIEAQALFES